MEATSSGLSDFILDPTSARDFADGAQETGPVTVFMTPILYGRDINVHNNCRYPGLLDQYIFDTNLHDEVALSMHIGYCVVCEYGSSQVLAVGPLGLVY